MSDILFSQGIENNPITVRALVYMQSGAAVTQVAVSNITAKVYSIDDATQVGTTITGVVADCVFDTLQHGVTTDFNLAVEFAGTYFPSGGTTYSIEICVTPVSGQVFYIVDHHRVLNMFSA